MKALEQLQKEVWGWDDLDTMPLMNFIIMKEMGAVLIGAYDRERLVGFAFGFAAFDHGNITFHSHMLAVLPAFRQHGIGQKLKLAQRQRALAKGFTCMTWTFDPLQSPNAHLNFSKLGVIASKYSINFYGEGTSSALHQHIGTDRLWVKWFLESERVSQRLDCGLKGPRKEDFSDLVSLVRAGHDGWPTANPITAVDGERLLIDIPRDIGALQRDNPALAIAWRNATRAAFTDALAAGYIVEEFFRVQPDGRLVGSYLLSSRMPNGIDIASK